MARSVALLSGVTACIESADDIDTVVLETQPQSWIILLGALQERDDFKAMLATYSARTVYGIDLTSYKVRCSETDRLLGDINGLIEKHFPRQKTA